MGSGDETEQATVYRAAGRRWPTLDGACRAAAKAKIKTRCDCCEGDSVTPPYACTYHRDMDRWTKMVRRLAQVYRGGRR